MHNSTVETLIAAFVVAVAAGFLMFAYSSTHRGAIEGYPLEVTMKSVEGIKTGADVRLHGIQIGSVSMIELTPRTYDALVHMSINDDVAIPIDSSLHVASGLMGTPYLAVEPGRSDQMLAAGQEWTPK